MRVKFALGIVSVTIGSVQPRQDLVAQRGRSFTSSVGTCNRSWIAGIHFCYAFVVSCVITSCVLVLTWVEHACIAE